MEDNRYNPTNWTTWDEKDQEEFDQLLQWFDQASPEDRKRFDNDPENLAAERQAWLRQMKA